MKLLLLLAGASLALATPVVAETLTSDQVVALSATGIGDEAVIAKIKSSGTKFDLTADQMIALKQHGVSGAVIAAMLNSGAASAQTAPTYSMDSPDPAANHPSGVYLLDQTGGQPHMVRIDPTTTNQAKTGGIIGYAMTGGIASMSVKASIQNDTARTKTTSRQPVFYFFFDESNPATAMNGGAWAAGTAATVSSPSEFTLIHLMKKEGRREARVGSMNIAGAKSGVMDKDRIAFDYTMVRPGVYRVAPTTNLDAGEYGFIYSISGNGAHGAITARIFDFSKS